METDKLLKEIATIAEDKGAYNLMSYNVAGKLSYTDRFLIMSASNERQVNAIAEHIKLELKKKGEECLGIEGQEGNRWVLVDFGDVICHVFHEEERDYYDLDDLYRAIINRNEDEEEEVQE